MFWDPDIKCDLTKLVWTNLDKVNSNGFELQPHFRGIEKGEKNDGNDVEGQTLSYAKFGI